jgi:hypothetical protein
MEDTVPKKISDMLRTTAENYGEFMMQVAEQFDRLESHVIKLEHRIMELENADQQPE